MKKNNDSKIKSVRGFSAMSPEKQKEIASKGGKSAHEKGVAHQWNTEEASVAGKKGVQKRKVKKDDTGHRLIL